MNGRKRTKRREPRLVITFGLCEKCGYRDKDGVQIDCCSHPNAPDRGYIVTWKLKHSIWTDILLKERTPRNGKCPML